MFSPKPATCSYPSSPVFARQGKVTATHITNNHNSNYRDPSVDQSSPFRIALFPSKLASPAPAILRRVFIRLSSRGHDPLDSQDFGSSSALGPRPRIAVFIPKIVPRNIARRCRTYDLGSFLLVLLQPLNVFGPPRYADTIYRYGDNARNTPSRLPRSPHYYTPLLPARHRIPCPHALFSWKSLISRGGINLHHPNENSSGWIITNWRVYASMLFGRNSFLVTFFGILGIRENVFGHNLNSSSTSSGSGKLMCIGGKSMMGDGGAEIGRSLRRLHDVTQGRNRANPFLLSQEVSPVEELPIEQLLRKI